MLAYTTCKQCNQIVSLQRGKSEHIQGWKQPRNSTNSCFPILGLLVGVVNKGVIKSCGDYALQLEKRLSDFFVF